MTDYFGFELQEEREIPELNTTARLFRHLRTGAELLSLENADENKVFGITFRTPPNDSTGVPHIMEHAVLCGSAKYPVKEPFVELEKGSLKTFLNAMTFPDKTCYPVASQNLQDFYNLIDVYMDAVLNPLITPQTLAQEGWHYELDNLEAPLVYKGVVFNEMKGAYSSPDNLLGRYAQRSLFPDTTYSVDSGGDPHNIPDLTYAQFKAFHETYYHPSNARIFFYGDDDPQERLRRMDGYLQGFQAAPVDSEISLQTPFKKPRLNVISYDAGEDSGNQKGMLVINWLLPDPLNQERSLALAILTYILIGTPASPLRKALIDSGLGEDLAGFGLENDLRQMAFSTGLKGIVDNNGKDLSPDYNAVENLVVDTLQRLADEGIDPKTITAALNTVEFRLRENNTGAFPRGLALMLRSLTTWLYGGDPLAPLAFESPLQAIKAQVAKGKPYFENLIRQFLLENTHRTTVILRPEPGLAERDEQVEREKLAAIRDAFTTEQLNEIVDNTRQLKLHQGTPDTPEALATIPSLRLEDLEPENKLIPLEVLEQSDGSRILYHDLFTNGIIYLDLGMNLHLLPPPLLPLAGLFGRVLLEMGAGEDDFVALSQRIGRSTGGIRPSYFTSSIVGTDEAAAWLFLRSKAVPDRVPELLQILHDILLTARLDNPERFRQMVLEEKANLEAALTPAGHRLVNTRLRSFFSEAGWLDEQMGGVSHLYFLRRLSGRIETDWPGVLAELEKIRHLLVNRRALVANVTLDMENWRHFQPQLQEFIAGLPVSLPQKQNWPANSIPEDQGLTIPSQVNFVGKGANLFDLGYQLNGSYIVIDNYLRTTWLWEKVRVQGGAYGGFCVFDHRSGVFTYLSYRDPNLLETLEIFDQTGKFLGELDDGRLSKEELTKSIIGAIGDLDAYQLPDAKGYTSMARYLVGDTDEMRQLRRQQILTTTLEEFHTFGEVLDRLSQSGTVVVIGAEPDIRSANAAGRRLTIEKVL
jgi:Zn-dependent M16 (insulinase) family peptidase